jgi:hypothetical protein
MNISAGTGLFTSMPYLIVALEKQYGIEEIKPTRSWTSVFGSKLEFSRGINFNIEGYYKHIFDRLYASANFNIDGSMDFQPMMNGLGRSWGLDMMLQKMQSRYWDGWISYSYNWTQHRDPDARSSADASLMGGGMGSDWYFPDYHRFHNLNFVFNFKPTPRHNIYTRLGMASGAMLMKRIGDGPESYPVYVFDSESGTGYFIEKYYWREEVDRNNRTTPELEMDIKYSFLGSSRNGKAQYEVYLAIENVLGLLYGAQGNTYFNEYTGEVATGSMAASYGMRFPIPSFGVRISY